MTGVQTCALPISKTVKGKGISFMENNVSWHGKGISDDDYNKAINELGGNVWSLQEKLMENF